jgi:tetratricopeptide (TPR) repeat protein
MGAAVRIVGQRQDPYGRRGNWNDVSLVRIVTTRLTAPVSHVRAAPVGVGFGQHSPRSFTILMVGLLIEACRCVGGGFGFRAWRGPGWWPGVALVVPWWAGRVGAFQASLVTEPGAGRYGMHDLVRAYAAELVRAGERRFALRRLLDHYLHSAYAADRRLNPHREPIALPPVARGVTIDDPAAPDPALAWFTTEYRVLPAAVDLAPTAGFDRHAWQLAWSIATFLDRRGYWSTWLATQRTALLAAQRTGDDLGRIHAHRGLAAAYTRLGRHPDARRHQHELLDVCTARGDRAGQAHTHRGIGVSYERQGRYADALDHARQALDLYLAAGDEVGQANALNEVGWYQALLGHHEEAIATCGQALALHRRHGNEYGAAAALDSLGYAHRHLGDPREAITRHRAALDLVRRLGVRYHEAEILDHLAGAHVDAGERDAARDAWLQALAILDDLGHPDAGRVRAEVRRLDPTS